MNRATGVQVRTPPRAQCRVASPERFVVCARGSQKEQTMKRILVIAAVATACGGSSGTAVDHNRAGSGSSTLLVTGTVTVTVSATAPLTSFSVTVKDGLRSEEHTSELQSRLHLVCRLLLEKKKKKKTKNKNKHETHA